MKRKLVLFLCLFTIAGFLFSQNDTIRNKRKIGFYTHVSSVQGNFSDLNSALVQGGYPELRDFYTGPTVGISLANKRNNSYSFVGISLLSSYPASSFATTTTKYAKLRGWEIQVGRTFDLVKNPKWAIYPYLAEGFGYGELTLYDNLVQQSFGNSIANLSNPASKTWSSFYLQFNGGLGIERRLRLGAYHFFVGATVGYRLTLSRFNDGYPYPYRTTVPLQLSGLETQIKIRFELWRKPKPLFGA